jgi:hypothetical protein
MSSPTNSATRIDEGTVAENRRHRLDPTSHETLLPTPANPVPPGPCYDGPVDDEQPGREE